MNSSSLCWTSYCSSTTGFQWFGEADVSHFCCLLPIFYCFRPNIQIDKNALRCGILVEMIWILLMWIDDRLFLLAKRRDDAQAKSRGYMRVTKDEWLYVLHKWLYVFVLDTLHFPVNVGHLDFIKSILHPSIIAVILSQQPGPKVF